jgi:hypothetical protein
MSERTTLPLATGKPLSEDRRADLRHAINGPAHMIDRYGMLYHVTLLDLSAGGAAISRPPVAEVFVGSPIRIAGQAMPWERHATIVAVERERLHLRFD